MAVPETQRIQAHVPLWIPALILGGAFALTITGLPGIPCIFHELTGLPCAGCGLTRSLKALWGGDIVTSLRFHPLGVCLFAVCAAALAAAALNIRMPRFGRREWLLVLCALLLVWALKLADHFLSRAIFIS